MSSRAAVSPVELELFRHALAAVCEEMGAVLRKASYSANIKERRDYSCALYDPAGDTVAMGDGMPVHLGAMPLAVREVLRSFSLAPGDVAIVNDPFRGGTHLPDITAVSAVYLPRRPRPLAYVANRAHHADVGGMSPGSMPLAREIYQEGLRIPPVLLVRGGLVNEELLSLVLANVRTPDERRGDLLAQWASLQRGTRRVLDLAHRWKPGRVPLLMAALQDYSEQLLRAELQRIPPGTYRAEDFLDGLDTGLPIRLSVALTVSHGQAHVDFTGTDPQVDGPVNANYAVTLAATGYVFRCLLPDETPYTAGLLRPITLTVPEGSVLSARPPAAMAAGNVETSQRVTDVLLRALAQALPDRIPAASSGTMTNLSFGGWDPIRARPFAYYETIAGGMGAGPSAPGHDATHTHMTNSWNTPVEAFEHQFPVRVRRYMIRDRAGGAGHHRGGDGIRRELQFLAPAEVTLLADRRDRGPYGLQGGGPGQPGAAHTAGASLPGRLRFLVQPGQTLAVDTPGGGGWGAAPGYDKDHLECM